VYCTLGQGQVPSVTILEIDVDNSVRYQEDTSDLSKFATDPNVTTAVAPKNYFFRLNIGDIVAVNGQPAKGALIRNVRTVDLSPTPNPGQAIADMVRNSVIADTFEILKTDGTPIGTIVSYGLAAGSPAPGAPLSITQGNFAIVGGTGAFLGARGQWGNAVTPQTITERLASVTEDPANRRRNGGGRLHFVLQVIPMFAPQIVTTANGPAVTHSSDFTLVSASKPATAGEILSLFATGLGPTKPGVDPGKPFPASPVPAVNSPVEVTVNGTSAEVLAAVGFPGTVDGYQVNFRVPPNTAKGAAAVQVSAAWIAGSPVSIAIQ
jgi:uncharacterized protein (TIGR03437 family)